MNNEISDRLKELAAAKGYTLYALSQASQLSPSALHAIASGKSRPSFDMLNKIAEAFPDLSIDWLVRGYGPMFKSAAFNPALPWEMLKQEEAQHEVLKQSYEQLKRRTQELSENIAWLTQELGKAKAD